MTVVINDEEVCSVDRFRNPVSDEPEKKKEDEEKKKKKNKLKEGEEEKLHTNQKASAQRRN